MTRSSLDVVALSRPLVAIDVETTGTDPLRDRIVEFAAVRFLPNGTVEELHLVLDPGVSIPAEAVSIHGLCDDDVVGCPLFGDVAEVILEFVRAAGRDRLQRRIRPAVPYPGTGRVRSEAGYGCRDRCDADFSSPGTAGS